MLCPLMRVSVVSPRSYTPSGIMINNRSAVTVSFLWFASLIAANRLSTLFFSTTITRWLFIANGIIKQATISNICFISVSFK